jgi:hypothetical protein
VIIIADIFRGKRQYPKRQNIWKILALTPKKFAFKYKMTPPNQNIIKIKVVNWLFSLVLKDKVNANIKFKSNGPHKSHCLIWFLFLSVDINGFTTYFILV